MTDRHLFGLKSSVYVYRIHKFIHKKYITFFQEKNTES